MSTLFYTAVLEAVTCCGCGVTFGIEKNHRAELLKTHKWFHCPNGHGQHYTGETELERKAAQLERDLANTQRCLTLAREQTVAERKERYRAERSVSARKGVITRMKRRVKAGRCVCCSAMFKDLRTHMKAKHPNYEPEKHVEALSK